MSITAFRIASCPNCDSQVLTARDLVEEALRDRCIHCDLLFDEEEVSWASPQEVQTLGYFIDGFEAPAPSKKGGCRGGSCGVRQPSGLLRRP